MLIPQSSAKQIDGSRPRYFRVTETQGDFRVLSRFMLDPEGMLDLQTSKHPKFSF